MKTLSKVCRIVGTTRKTLRGYDEIGLLHPTAKTENGYWLYDDSAISKLKFIQIFADAGYERSVIKEILENPAADFLDEYDNVIASLEERKRMLTAQIKMLTRLKLIAGLPRKIHAAFEKTALAESFLSAVNGYASGSPQALAKSDEVFPLLCQLTAIGLLKREDPSSDAVQELVKSCCSYLRQVILIGESDTDCVFSDREASELMTEWLQNMPQEEPAFSGSVGTEGIDFIRSAFHIHTENLKKEQPD